VAPLAPPPPPPPPKPPAPIEQVAVQIKKAIGEGADKINIKLQPANLGKVEVRMEIGKDGILTANVIAERPETLELLQRDVRGLEKVLQEGGLKTDTQSFNFSLKEHAQQQVANGRDKTDEQTDNKDKTFNDTEANDVETTASEAAIYGQNIATNGGVNIMI
jgi:flagellar hook-length control protein FliK